MSMAFHSYAYVFVFLPAVFILYSIFRKTRFANPILLVSSYIFYTGGSLFLFAGLAYVSLFDYGLALKIHGASSERKKKIYLCVSIVGTLTWLCVFKYLHWFISLVNLALIKTGLGLQIPAFEIPLPPGISFYTFQTMSYILDVYRGNRVPERNIVTYLTYVAFFPQLVAGPIERAGNLLTQLKRVRERVSSENFENGVFRICWGLFKKVVFADNLGHVVDLCLNALYVPGAGLIAVYAFGFQIYCDFSAYTDIAIGSAKLFNVELTRNFLTPYFASSPSDFWRRWHISLSNWLKDYIYTPLAFSRRDWGEGGVVFALMTTFFLCGLWHGAGGFFILWGLYQGFLLVLYRFLPIDQWMSKKWGRWGRGLSVFLMFHLTFLGWLFFRSNPSSTFLPICQSIAALFHRPFDSMFWSYLYGTVLFATPVLVTEWIGYRRGCEFVELYPKFRFWTKVFLYVLMFYGVCLLGKRETYDFIYFAF